MVKKKSLKILIILSVVLIAFTSMASAAELTSTPEDPTLLVSEEPSDALIATQEETLDESLVTPTSEGNIDVIYEEDTETVPTIPEIVSHDVFVTTNNYILAENEHINGNVYIMANNVTINGFIEGNTFILAQKVSINSPCRIEKSLYIAANTIDFNGGYLFDIYATASKIDFTRNAYAIRDAKFAAETINLAGYFGRNLDLAANKINPDLEDLKVQNNFSYSAPEPIKDVQLNVEGDVKYDPTEKTEVKNVIIEKLTSFIQIIVFSLVIASLLIFVFKKYPAKSANVVEAHPIKAFFYGLLVIVCVPILSILLFITLFGACLGGALLFSLAAVLSISNILVALAFARKIKGEDKKATLLYTLLFVCVIWVLKLIPVVKVFVTLFVPIFGTGIFTLSILEKSDSKPEVNKVEYGKEELEEIKAEEKAEKEEKKAQKAESKTEKKVEKKPTEKKTTTKSTKKK